MVQAVTAPELEGLGGCFLSEGLVQVEMDSESKVSPELRQQLWDAWCTAAGVAADADNKAEMS